MDNAPQMLDEAESVEQVKADWRAVCQRAQALRDSLDALEGKKQ